MAAKIKDGLFIGDAETSQSEVFINDNKISNLINLSGREVQNMWASHGLVYLTYYWEDRTDYKLFSGHEDSILNDIVEFVDVSISHGISVLLFSRKGSGRCVVALCVYLMMKYRWGFEKTYDFVYSKKPDIELNKGFIQQMFALDMKLLAARQRAYSIRHGTANDFKIEANMTITDIAAMLPTSEAKRWNAWDVEYLLEELEAEENSLDAKEEAPYQNGILKRSTSYRRSAGVRGDHLSNRQRSRDEIEEELLLVNSFINSKNTITALPGPYRNAYETPKNFVLRFNNVCQEEDIHMFPTSPLNPRFAPAPQPVVKGSRKRRESETERHALSKKADAKVTGQDFSSHSKELDRQSKHYRPSHPAHRHSHDDADSKHEEPVRLSRSREPDSDLQVLDVDELSLPSQLTGTVTDDAQNYAHVAEEVKNGYGVSNAYASSATSISSNASRRSNNNTDLYGFVGMAPNPQEVGSSRQSVSTSSSASRKEARNGHEQKASVDNNSHLDAPVQSASAIIAQTTGPLSAEDRLRKLMADMQKQNYYKGSNSSNNNVNGRGSNPTPDTRAGTEVPTRSSRHTDQQPVEQQSGRTAPSNRPQPMQTSTSSMASASPSLYDLANMHVDKSGTASNNGASKPSSRGEVEYEDVELSISRVGVTPAAYDAMQRQQQQQAMLQPTGRPVRATPQDVASMASSRGAVRARHDIVTNANQHSSGASGNSNPSGSRPAKMAWAAAPANNSGSIRSSSPSVRNMPQDRAGSSSNVSVGSVGSQSSSAKQAYPGVGSSNAVGTGGATASRVYRHGSPAPNTGRSGLKTTSRANPASSSAPEQLTSRYAQRYPSPSNGVSSAQTVPSSGRKPAAASTSSVNSLNSSASNSNDIANAANRRRGVGASPLRPTVATSSTANGYTNTAGSARRAPSPTAAGSSTGSSNDTSYANVPGANRRRFMTPTPQSNQHHDYDNASVGSSGSNNLNSGNPYTTANARVLRSSTPTRNSWRF